MTEHEIGKIKMFMGDVIMSDLVYQSLLDAFLKKRQGEDIQTKAARMIAIELLQEAWDELAKIKEREKPTSLQPKQYGM